MLLGYLLKDYKECGAKIPVHITLSKKTNNILIAGKSGSGKSLAALWYTYNQLSTGESYVFLSDYKAGEEYKMFESLLSYASGSDAIQMIQSFYQFFTSVRTNRIKLTHHYVLFIEEWFGLLTFAESQSKKLKADLMAMVGEILAVGRGLNFGIMLCVQRADASLFSGGARDQFQCSLSFGRCAAEQFKMLGFSGELENNPTNKYKSGQALALIDGEDNIKELIVPLIKNPDTLCQGIRMYLEKQLSIPELLGAIAEGKSSQL